MEHLLKTPYNKKKRNKALLLIIGVFVIQWFLLFRMAGPTWDEVFYYVYGRSVVFDQDLHLQNDFLLSYESATPDFVAKDYHLDLTQENRVANPFAIGTSILWFPWLFTIRFAVATAGDVGLLSGEWTGYEWPFYGGMAVLSSLIGLLAFLLAYQVAKKEVSRISALLATLTLMFATPLLHYQFRLPMYSHTMSAFTTTLVVYVWQRQYKSLGSPIQAILLGAVIGLAGLTRWQNVMYLALPFLSTAFWWAQLPVDEKRQAWKRVLLYVVFVGGTAVFIFSLQLAVWQRFYGSWITVPQGDAFMDWRAPFVNQVLFSTFHGLLAWMPVFFLAILGLIAMLREKAAFVVPLLIVLILEVYVNGSTRDWFGAGGFGGRRFTSELAILMIGYAGFLQFWPNRIRVFLGGLLGIVLAIYNWTLMRYAMPEKIGGHVVSMYPKFEWVEESYVTFLPTMFNRALNAVRQPLDFFLVPSSPAYMMWQQRSFPTKQLAAFFATAIFICVLWFGGRSAWKRLKQKDVPNYVFVAIVVVVIVTANVWILFQS